ncbi:MAG: HIRAN domain-containing protein [Nitrospinae bacterium]|nr:HIRAN domain-containing protein [Nitrospinota bacterium]
MKRRDLLKNLFAFPAFLFSFDFKKEPEPKKPQPLSVKVPIAGFQYYQGEQIWKKLRKNDPLRLQREPGNPHDPQAIEVFWMNKKLGYVPRSDNPILAQLMDKGCAVKAEICRLKKSGNPWERVEARVELWLWEERA